MAGRNKPNWVVFEGGPFNGQERLLPPQATDRIVMSGSVYKITTERRKMKPDGGLVRGTARVAGFVGPAGRDAQKG